MSTTGAPTPPVAQATRPARPVRPVPTVIALLVGALMSQLDLSLVGTAMPHISAELRDVSLYTWVFFAYAGAYTATGPTYGMLADTLGRRVGYLLALGVLTLGSLGCGLASSMTMLVAGRFVQGLGAAGVFVIAQTILGDLFPGEKRARIQSAVGLISGVSISLGPMVGGLFVTHATWRLAFLVNLPIAAGAAILFAIGYADPPDRRKKPVNWLGGLLLAAMLWTFFFGIRKDHLEPLLVAAGGVLAIPFFLHQRRSTQQLLPPDLFLHRAFTLGALLALLLGGVQMSNAAFMPLYLQGVVGLGPTAAGYLLGIPVTVGATVTAFFTGTLITRLGYRTVLAVGMAMLLANTVALATAAWVQAASPHAPSALALLELGQLALGCAIGMAYTGLMICVQNQVDWSRRGTATAALHLLRTVGGTLGPALLGVLYLLLLQKQDLGLPPEKFLNQKILSQLDPAALARARAALGVALRALLTPLVAMGGIALVTALFFPKKVEAVADKTS